MKRILLAGALALTSTLGQAALIGNYSLSGNIVTDSNRGLDWLRWDQTVGLSINDALAANSGWQLASFDQVVNLLNDFDLDDDPASDPDFDATSLTTQFVFSEGSAGSLDGNGAYQLSEAGNDLTFIELFGDTYSGTIKTGILDDVAAGTFVESSALFALSPGTGAFLAQVADDWDQLNSSGDGIINSAGQAGILEPFSSVGGDTSGSVLGITRGVALVRSTPTAPTPMPEPSMLMLFAGGLLGLGLIRRRKINS